jgi:hypothetical protein
LLKLPKDVVADPRHQAVLDLLAAHAPRLSAALDAKVTARWR